MSPSNTKENPSRHSSSNPTSLSLFLTYLLLGIYRTLNALFVQTQFDPDEYWQTLEPSYCLSFSPTSSSSSSPSSSSCALTWEWTRRSSSQEGGDPLSLSFWETARKGPVRSYLPLLPTILFYRLLRWIRWDTGYLVAKGPALFHAWYSAAPVDLAVYCLARHVYPTTTHTATTTTTTEQHVSSPAFWALVTSITLWFHGYASVRTYANATEALCTVWGIVLLAPDLFGPFTPGQCVARPTTTKLAFVIGGIAVAVRFTALAAWIPIGLILCFGWGNKRFWIEGVRYVMNPCALWGAVGLGIVIGIDRWFYGFWAVPFLGNLDFNVWMGNGALYGTHPWYWYLLAGLPAVTGIFLPFFLYEAVASLFYLSSTNDFAGNAPRRKLRPTTVLLIVISSYVIFHSVSPHKEFRFLMPILPLACVLSGGGIHRFVSSVDSKDGENDTRRKRRMRKVVVVLVLMFLGNYPHLIYLCTVHQRAPIQLNEFLRNLVENEVRRGEYYSYFPPSCERDGTTNVADLPLGTTRDDPEVVRFTAHYLMGCHSTPVHSHLHIPVLVPVGEGPYRYVLARIDPWTLDCGPECRKKGGIACEDRKFGNDPLSFMERTYGTAVNGGSRSLECVGLSGGGSSDVGEGSPFSKSSYLSTGDLIPPRRHPPDFLAIYESELLRSEEAVLNHIQNEMGMVQVAKFRHLITGVSFQYETEKEEGVRQRGLAGAYQRMGSGSSLGGFGVKFEWEHMVLFRMKKVSNK